MSHAATLPPAAAPATPTATDAAPRPPAGLLLLQREALRYLGVGRTKWFGLRSAGKLPAPVNLDGTLYWRRADLEEFVGRLRPVKRMKRAAEAATAAGE